MLSPRQLRTTSHRSRPPMRADAPDSHDESAGDNSNVRPEPVEGPSVHGSTSSPRTDYRQAPNMITERLRRSRAMPPPGRRNLRLHRIAACRTPQPRGLAETDSARCIRNRTSKRSCISARVAGIHTRVLRRDCDELLAFRLLVGTEYAEYAWDVIMHAGRQFGIMPVGSEAVHRARRGDP